MSKTNKNNGCFEIPEGLVALFPAENASVSLRKRMLFQKLQMILQKWVSS